MQNAISSTTSINAAAAPADAETVVTHVTTVPAANDSAAPQQPTEADVLRAIKSTSDYLDDLHKQSNEWANNAYKTSNEQLYALLQKCYCLYKAISADSTEAAALREGLKSYISKKGYIFTKSTHSMTKIVKCVFGADRRRVSAYSIVLRAALAQGVGMFDIADFIRDAGGVEEVRLGKSPTAKTPKQKSELVRDQVKRSNLGDVKADQVSSKFDALKIGSNTVLIGTWQADGSIVVRAVVESDTVLTAAMASHYTNVKKTLEEQEKNQLPTPPVPPAPAATPVEDSKSAVDEAVASATVDA